MLIKNEKWKYPNKSNLICPCNLAYRNKFIALQDICLIYGYWSEWKYVWQENTVQNIKALLNIVNYFKIVYLSILYRLLPIDVHDSQCLTFFNPQQTVIPLCDMVWLTLNLNCFPLHWFSISIFIYIICTVAYTTHACVSARISCICVGGWVCRNLYSHSCEYVCMYVCALRRMAREAAQARPKQIFTFNCETRQFNKLIKYLILLYEWKCICGPLK